MPSETVFRNSSVTVLVVDLIVKLYKILLYTQIIDVKYSEINDEFDVVRGVAVLYEGLYLQ